MITLDNVAVEFGTQQLYRDVSLLVGPQDRVGLVGPNGSGKSTIFKMIAGLERPSSGELSIRRGTKIAYLPQTGAVAGDRTVFEEALSAFGGLEEVHQSMVKCEREMGRPGLDSRRLDALLKRYADLQHHYEQDAYTGEARAKKVLVRLGFSQGDFDKQMKTQSGGFQVRLTLARMLLEEPDLLLLDEPTNYLDIRSIEWLQEYLSGFKGAFVMVTHDRYLLDGLVERIWAIENRRVLVFQGGYSRYLEDKVLRDRQQQKKYEEQQVFIKRTETFVARFKGRKDTAKRALSRQKMLDKLERIESPREDSRIRIRFPEAEDIHGKALELDAVGKGFDGRPVFSGAGLILKGGEKLGLFGVNGAGKTTLLRIIAGRLKPDRGSVWWSRKTRIAYYEQGAEDRLDPDLTVLESVRRVAEGYTENELKGMLGVFLFRGDEVEKKVTVLSGGERSRLAIICVLLAPSNLLILDEPTNHLDIQSREVLFDAIEVYRKTVVFAAHDRFMLDRLADKVARVEGGEVVLFPGNYSWALHRSQPARGNPLRKEPPINTDKHRGKNGSRKADSESDARHSEFGIRNSAFNGPMVRLTGRLQRVKLEYDEARERLDFSRARELAQEQREVEAEIERVKAVEVAEGGEA